MENLNLQTLIESLRAKQENPNTTEKMEKFRAMINRLKERAKEAQNG